MIKVDGVKVSVGADGVVDMVQTLAAWELRQEALLNKERPKFQKLVEERVRVLGEWHDNFTLYLDAFWEKYAGATIPKPNVISMPLNAMLNDGVFPIGKLSEMTELFTNFVESNCGEPGSDAMMSSERGRNGGVRKQGANRHIRA